MTCRLQTAERLCAPAGAVMWDQLQRLVQGDRPRRAVAVVPGVLALAALGFALYASYAQSLRAG